MANGTGRLSQTEIARAWAKITVKEWRRNLVRMKVMDRGALFRSFMFSVIGSAGGDVTRITLAFEYYGRFVDMGVGRGTRIGQVKENAVSRRLEGKMLGNRRRPKKWYSRRLAAETLRLEEIMAEEYGIRMTAMVKETLESGIGKKASGINNPK